MEQKKENRRQIEVRLIESETPINLRVVAELIAKKISKGEIEL